MSEYADKHSKAHRKERVDHILNDDRKGKIDASGYTVPGALEPEKKTGPEQPKPRKFAKGGMVEGHKANHHAGRKSRGAGGPTAVEQLRPQVPSGGLYGSGFSPTHAGMLSNAAGLKKGGEAKHKAKGGEAGADRHWNLTKGATKMRVRAGDYNSMLNRSGAHGLLNADSAVLETNGEADRQKAIKAKQDIDGGKYPGVRFAKAKGGEAVGTSDVTGVRVTGGRKARAEGGRAKGKTNINIIIGAPKEAPAGPPVPPPPSAMPPKPGLPPAAMGAMVPPGMGGGAGPAGPMPPQMPAGMGPR